MGLPPLPAPVAGLSLRLQVLLLARSVGHHARVRGSTFFALAQQPGDQY